jgi:hypothetical protein
MGFEIGASLHSLLGRRLNVLDTGRAQSIPPKIRIFACEENRAFGAIPSAASPISKHIPPFLSSFFGNYAQQLTDKKSQRVCVSNFSPNYL